MPRWKDPVTTPTPSSFIDWLTAMTRALGYNRDSELARALQVDQSIVSRWRKGSRPSVEHLARVSALTGTPLEPLLVLADYVSASAVRNATVPEPPAPTTPGERVIKEARIPDVLKNELRGYWSHRMREERARLSNLVQILEQTAGGKLTQEGILDQIAAKVFVSDLSNHVVELLRASADVIDQREGSPEKELVDG